jgi:hypothetical protein
MVSQFRENSGLIPLVYSPGIGPCDWGFLGVPICSQGFCSGLCGAMWQEWCPYCLTAWRELAGRFFSPVFLGLMDHLLQVGTLKWSH